MGHAKVTTTLAIYTHLFDDDHAETMAALGSDVSAFGVECPTYASDSSTAEMMDRQTSRLSHGSDCLQKSDALALAVVDCLHGEGCLAATPRKEPT